MTQVKVDFEAFYLEHVKPLLDKEWIRSDHRRVIRRMEMMSPRHRINIKTYHRIMHGEGVIRTMTRDLLILPFMEGKKIGVYDGRTYVVVVPDTRQVGLRLGELVYPKKAVHVHTSKTKVKKQAK